MNPLYLGAVLLICLTPGPNVFLCISCGLQRGVDAVVQVVAGIAIASTFFLALAALGVAALLQASPAIFGLLRAIGAAYLIYLAARLWLASRATVSLDRRVVISGSPLIQGFVTHVSNPKAILFWTSILPQFIDSHHSVVPQTLRLGVVGMLIDAAILFSYGAAAAILRERLLASGFARWLDRVAAVFFLAVGSWLLWSLRPVS